MKTLLIEDDVHVAEFLKAHLPQEGFAVDVATTGAEGIRLATDGGYDLMLLDLHLPDMGGEALIRSLRKQKRVPPILMLTVVADAWSKVRLIEAGADDYLVKPFLLEELVARMRALLRRGSEEQPDILKVGTLELDIRARLAFREGKRLSLTPKELALLEYLVRNRGQVVSRTTLVEHVWDSSADPFLTSIDVHIANLRKKLGLPIIIETVHSQGYLVPEE